MIMIWFNSSLFSHSFAAICHLADDTIRVESRPGSFRTNICADEEGETAVVCSSEIDRVVVAMHVYDLSYFTLT